MTPCLLQVGWRRSSATPRPTPLPVLSVRSSSSPMTPSSMPASPSERTAYHTTSTPAFRKTTRWSTSRGSHSPTERHNRELFQQRWGDRVERDSILYYIDDGLLQVADGALYPLVAKGSPELLVATAENDDA